MTHAVPEQFSLSDLPHSPPSTPRSPTAADELFNATVFSSAAVVGAYHDYRGPIQRQVSHAPMPIVPPHSVHISVLEYMDRHDYKPKALPDGLNSIRSWDDIKAQSRQGLIEKDLHTHAAKQMLTTLERDTEGMAVVAHLASSIKSLALLRESVSVLLVSQTLKFDMLGMKRLDVNAGVTAGLTAASPRAELVLGFTRHFL